MRFLYLLLLVSCDSLNRQLKDLNNTQNKPFPVIPEPEIPDRQLKEIVVYGSYYPYEKESRPSNYDPSKAYKPFNYNSRYYCYNDKKKKEPVYDKSLKIRLFDKENGKRLAEDFLRLKRIPNKEIRIVISYLPYRELSEGKIHIVRVKEGKEDLIEILDCCASHKSLVKGAAAYEFYTKSGRQTFDYRYDKESECYISFNFVM